jgi:hypothetical protein
MIRSRPRRLAARVVGERRRDRAEPGGLLHQLGVLVADVDVDELRGEVEVSLAAVICEVRATGAGDRQRVDQCLRRPGVEYVSAVVGADAGFVCGDAAEEICHEHDLATNVKRA